jgi:malic enzyme
MGDSRTRAEDKLAELAEAEENQRQMLAATPAPSLARVLKDATKNRATTGQPPPSEPEDDGPAIELTHRCGPVQVDSDGTVIIGVGDGCAWASHAQAKEIWEALTVLIREEVIK